MYFLLQAASCGLEARPQLKASDTEHPNEGCICKWIFVQRNANYGTQIALMIYKLTYYTLQMYTVVTPDGV